MENLLKINNVIFPNIDMDYNVSYSDEINIYKSESGEKTIEVIREGICSIEVKYEGLLERRIQVLCNAIKPLNEVEFFNPINNHVEKKLMKADTNRISLGKICFKDDIKAWSISFRLEEV